MERIFTNALKKQLRKRIKGTISVHIINDILIIDIYDNSHKCWRYTISNIAWKISTGLSSYNVADIAVKEYRVHIMHEYFR